MKTTKTDREQSLVAVEFVWDTEGNTDVHTLVFPRINKWLKDTNTTKLLDLGCGNGALTSLISKEGITSTGTDYSESGVKIAKETYTNVDFFQSSIETPLLAEYHHKFDTVISVEVIEHLLLPRQLFERAKEALKPGGYLIVTTPYHGFWKNLALAITNSFDHHWHPLRDFGHVKFFSEATLKYLFLEQGFEVLEFKRVGRIPIFGKSMMIKGRLKTI
jgi:2-polyprenyl-3-methyl-5-hydroxy-6-metoxy-1,4-benzoquinol methylase